MTALPARARRSRTVPIAVAATVLAIVVGTRLADAPAAAGAPGAVEPLLVEPPAAEVPTAEATAAQAPAEAGVTGTRADDPLRDAERAAIRADIDFWSARLVANPSDLVAAVALADAHVTDARATGDASGFVRAEAAAEAALDARPGYVPALAVRASIRVALHRFGDARDDALAVLERVPDDPTALGALGDASLELGDVAAARAAYGELLEVADGAAARVRAGRLAFLTGDMAGALDAHRTAVAMAADEGLEGGALAFHHVTLAQSLLAAGDPSGAREAFQAALDAQPGHPAALAGLARIQAFEGDVDGAIASLDAALAAIPDPGWLALRSDLLERRAGPGDAAAAAADRATVEAIASLAGGASGIHDRGFARFLADHGIDPERAVALAAAELEVRRDVYGHDTLAWALVAAGRPEAAVEPMARALALGTPDAQLRYHAGIVAAATGDPAAARAHLDAALALGPALDPVARDRAAAARTALGDVP